MAGELLAALVLWMAIGAVGPAVLGAVVYRNHRLVGAALGFCFGVILTPMVFGLFLA